MTISKITAALFMFIGVFFLSTKAQLIIPNFGDLLIVLACVFWSTGNVLIRRILKGNPVSGEVVALLRPISGFPLILLFVLLAPFYPNKLQNVFQVDFFNLDYIGYVIITGILAAMLTIFLTRTLKLASASYMTMMSMMTPVFVTVLAFVFLNERMAVIQIIGAVLIIMSGVVTHYMKVAEE